MSTRGILIIGTKLYDINHDADIYAKKLFVKVLKIYNPKSAREFITRVNQHYSDPSGGYIMVNPNGYPLAGASPDPLWDEAVFKVNLNTRTVKMRKLRRGVTKFPVF